MIKKESLIIIFALLILPTMSFFLNYVLNIKPKFMYDLFWIGALFGSLLTILHQGKIKNINKYSILLWNIFIITIIYILSKYLINAFIQEYYNYFNLVPFLREIKPFFYFLVAFLIVHAFGTPKNDVFYKLGFYFSLLILVDFIMRIIFYGMPVRPHVADESNYDNLLVLVSLISWLHAKGFKVDKYFIIFLSATLVSQSKTGIIIFFIIVCVYIFDVKKIKYIVPIAFLTIVGGFIIITRLDNFIVDGQLQWERIDRFRMYFSYFDLISESSYFKLLFGFLPGYPLKLEDTSLDWFIVHQSEAVGAVGLHPFNYHGMWLRLISSWGLLPICLLILFFIKIVKINRTNIAITLLILLEGMTMGVFYLSTVSIILYLFIFLRLEKVTL